MAGHFGHYGGLLVRMAWHSAGTYRITDGRGGAGAGQQGSRRSIAGPTTPPRQGAPALVADQAEIRPENILGRPDNSRRQCRPPTRWGCKTYGFGGGRANISEPEELYWGPEGKWLDDERYSGERQLQNPLAAVQMGLIYVNPEGPNGKPDPLAAAKDIRETFARMAMNNEETVALIAGGHTFGKTHGAGDPSLVGPAPEGAALESRASAGRASSARAWVPTRSPAAPKSPGRSGIPWAWAAFRIAAFTLLPFGHRAVRRDRITGRADLGTGPAGFLGNVIWLLLAGWWLALGHLIAAALLTITVIGIPFAWAHLKLAGLALWPVGSEIVPIRATPGLRRSF